MLGTKTRKKIMQLLVQGRYHDWVRLYYFNEKVTKTKNWIFYMHMAAFVENIADLTFSGCVGNVQGRGLLRQYNPVYRYIENETFHKERKYRERKF